MLLEDKVEMLVRGYVEYTADGKYSVGNKEFTLDEGYYIVGFDREGNMFEVEKTDNVDLTEFELEFEYGDIDYWVKDDIGVLVINSMCI